MNGVMNAFSPSPAVDPTTARIRHYISRLIDAGATGLADTLVSKALYAANTRKSSPLSSSGSTVSSPVDYTPTNTNTNTNDVWGSHRPIELVNRELKPITWTMWIINILSLSFYISETGYHYFGGIDLSAFFHRRCFRSRSKKRNPRICCGCRRTSLPFFHRIHNSYVTWNSQDRILIGTPPTNDEFGFLKITVLQQLLMFLIPSLLMIIFSNIVFLDVKGFAPWHIMVRDHLDVSDITLTIRICYGLVVPCILIGLSFLLLYGPSLVGSRNGSLPILMPHLLQTSTPEYMISYAWSGGMAQLARSLGEILPNAWLDVRSLVGGQLVSRETYLGAAHARVTILLLTPQYLRSRNCAGEFLAVVSERRHTGDTRCHQTIVLIEENLLQSSNGIDTVDPRLQEYRRTLELSGYSVAPTHPDIKWQDITTILREIGCIVVHSVDDLLNHLQLHACRATTHDDMVTCLHWWTRYGRGLTAMGSSSIGNGTSGLRVPWNILGSKAQHGKRRMVPPLCDRWRRVCCRRRPYKRTGLVSWEEDSVTTGIHGGWIPYDAADTPQPHADITTQYVLALIALPIIIAIVAYAIVLLSLHVDLDTNIEEQFARVRDILDGIGAGAILSCFLAMAAYLGFFFYSTDIFTPLTILHSSVLFPYFALSEVQDIAQMDETTMDTVNHAPSTVEVPQSGTNPKNTMVIRNPMTNLANPVSQTNIPSSSTVIVPRAHQRRKFTVQFCHDGSEISNAIENFNLFIACNVFGLDKDTDKDNGYPQVLSAAEVLSNPEHPRSLTIYVFFLDTKRSQDAWTRAMVQPHCRWRPDHVVLVTNRSGLESGTDLVSAEGLLKKLLILKTDSTGNGGGQTMVNEILHCFDQLDQGITFPVNATTIPSSQAARESLHELLPRLGFIQVPCVSGYAYTSPRALDPSPLTRTVSRSLSSSGSPVTKSFSSSSPLSTGMNVPLLLPTLGPLLAYGPAESTVKRRIVEAVEKGINAKLNGKSGTEDELSSASLDVSFGTSGSSNVSVPRFPISDNHLPSALVNGNTTTVTSNVHNPVSHHDDQIKIDMFNSNHPQSLHPTTSSLSSPVRSPSTQPGTATTKTANTLSTTVTKASNRIQDHMLIVYETVPDLAVLGGKRAVMSKDSPYRGLVPAVLEAVSSKFGTVLLASGGIAVDNDNTSLTDTNELGSTTSSTNFDGNDDGF